MGLVILDLGLIEIDGGLKTELGGFVLTNHLDRYNYSGLYNVSLENYARGTLNLIRVGDITLQLFAIAHFNGFDWYRSRLDKSKLSYKGYEFMYERLFFGAAIKF